MQRNKTIIGFVFMIVLVMGAGLLMFRSVQQSGDSLSFAAEVRDGGDLAHPHHLIFKPVVRILHTALKRLHISSEALLAGQVHNVFWGMTILFLLYFLARRLTHSHSRAVLAVLLFFSCGGFLTFATEVDVPMASLGGLMISLAVVVLGPWERRAFWASAALSLAWASAILYHQSHVIFLIPLSFWVLSGGGKNRWVRLFGLVVATGSLALSFYLLFFLQSPYAKTISGLMSYFFHFKMIPIPGWGTMENVTPLGVAKVFHSQLSNFIILPKPYLVALTPLMALFVCFLLVWHWQVIRKKGAAARIRMFLVVWLLSYYAFFIWWLPGEEEYFFATSVPILLLAFICADDIQNKLDRPGRFKRIFQFSAGACIVLLLSVNIVGSVLPRHSSQDEYFLEAEALSRFAGMNVLVCTSYEIQQNLKYYFSFKRVVEDSIPLIYRYRNLPLPNRFSVRSGQRILFPVETLSPGFEIGRLSGFRKPAEWRSFLGYLLDVRNGEPGNSLSCRSFSCVSARRAYLMIEKERSAFASWPDLLRALEYEWQDCFPKGAEALRRWIGEQRMEHPSRGAGGMEF